LKNKSDFCFLLFFKAKIIRCLKVNKADENSLTVVLRGIFRIINCFKLSGENNINLLLTSSSLDKLDTMVNFHFRRNSNISNIVIEIVVDMAKDFILPVDFRIQDQNPTEEEGCGEKCVRRIKGILETQSKKA